MDMFKKAVIFFLIVLLFAFGVGPRAQAKTPPPVSAGSESQSATDGGAMEDETGVVVEYVLPYPGILPDHPLFAIKMLRDWIFERLISDPFRKTEFYILQADKRLSMALAFIDSSKPEGALAAAADAQEFMEKALTLASSQRAAGQQVPGHILDRFERSIAKHIEVIGGLTLQGEEQARASYRAMLDAFKTFAKEAEALQ